jgi:hypothetical protein
VELFFHGINGNILFCCTINELHEAMSFSLAQEIDPIRNITVRLEHAVHIRKLHHRPIPFHRPNVANAVSIQLQLIFRLPEKALDRPTLSIVTQAALKNHMLRQFFIKTVIISVLLAMETKKLVKVRY